MTLLDAPVYNSRKARLIRNISITTFVLIVVLGVSGFLLRHWPAEHRLNVFFDAVQSQNLPKAFGIWNQDPDWQQHPDKYKDYPFATFSKDWGPGSDYGVIRSHTILMTASVGNGTVMGVTINGGKTPIFLRIDDKTKTVGFSPVELYTGP